MGTSAAVRCRHHGRGPPAGAPNATPAARSRRSLKGNEAGQERRKDTRWHITSPTPKTIRESVRSHYPESALAVMSRRWPACCGPAGIEDATWREAALGVLRPCQREGLPDTAVLASLGCGNPTAVAELAEGETVLDLGSGGGIDVILSPGGSGHLARPTGLT